MNRSPRIRVLALAVALAMLSTGCIVIPGGGGYRRRHCSTTVESSGKLETVGTRTGSAVTISQEPASSEGGLRTVRGGEGALALLFALGVVIGVLVVVDILLLPATVPNDNAFCCTTTVVRHCYH